MQTNEGSLDRTLRIIAGIALIVVGGAVGGGAGVVVAIVGLVPLLTGIAGRCPIYALLHIDTLGAGRGRSGGAQPR